MNSTPAVALLTSSTMAIGTSGAGACAAAASVNVGRAASVAARSVFGVMSVRTLVSPSTNGGINTRGAELHRGADAYELPPDAEWLIPNWSAKAHFASISGQLLSS